MFAWFKNRQLKEHKKLLYQNIAAAQFFMGLFESNRQNDHVLKMIRYVEETRRVANRFTGIEPIPYNDLTMLLEINKDLRRIDHFVFESVTHFDKTYEPVGGWDHFYKIVSLD